MKLTVEWTDDEAEAMAQLCKRFGLDHATQLAHAFDGNRERDHMIDGVSALRRALREAGLAPR